MNWLMISRIALLALLRNKTRSFLTMLGIIIGVAAVITMLALGTGAQNSVQASIASLGTNTIAIAAGSSSSGGARSGSGTSSALKITDAEAVKANIKELQYVSPVTQNSAQIIFQEQNWSSTVVGVNEEYEQVKNWKVKEGRFITDDDVRGCTKVCILGSEVVNELFGNSQAIGQTVRVGRIPMRVVGTLTSKGEGGFGPSQDDIVLVPITTAMRRLFNLTNIRFIQCSARSEEVVDKAVTEITSLMRQRHRLLDGEEDDFSLHTQAEFAQTMESTIQTFTYLLGGIASVSLMVGGIGIMNIMLVSVTERIREIGIRMALGATGNDILRQFLIEALILSLMGGAIGILLAFGLTYVGSKLIDMTMTISPFSILVSFFFSAGVGVFFGLYPAVSASKLDPIQALRHE